MKKKFWKKHFSKSIHWHSEWDMLIARFDNFFNHIKGCLKKKLRAELKGLLPL